MSPELLEDYKTYYRYLLNKDFLELFPVAEKHLNIHTKMLMEWEKKALYHYTDHGYFALNDGLRKGITNNAYVNSYKNILNYILDKLPDHGLCFVFRGISTNESIDVTSFYQVGKIIEDTTFTSTSLDRKIAKELFIRKFYYKTHLYFEIISKRGKLISSYSMNPEEQEVLFKTNSMFQVRKLNHNAEENVYTIVMEEL